MQLGAVQPGSGKPSKDPGADVTDERVKVIDGLLQPTLTAPVGEADRGFEYEADAE